MSNSWRISLTVAFISLGLLLSLQFRTQQEFLKDLSSQKTEDLVIVLRNLSEKRSSLNQELWDLRNKVRAMETESLRGKELHDSLREDSAKLKASSGLEKIKGPGLQLTISPDTPIFYEDLLKIVNELWNVEAEGIAVNGIRVNYYTPISEDPTTLQIKVGNQLVDYPIVISAIGNPEKLKPGILIAGGTIEQLRFYAQVMINVETKETVVLPASKEIPAFKFATPVKKVK